MTKLAAEGLCRQFALETGLNCVVLRTSRFFPEEDDTLSDPTPEKLKANEFLHRRLTVEDAARAHLVALKKAPDVGFGLYIVSAPSPFDRSECAALKRDAVAVILQHFPDAADLYANRGWRLPQQIGRIYDASRIGRELGFRCETDFAAMLEALRSGAPMPFAHDGTFRSPSLHGRALIDGGVD